MQFLLTFCLGENYNCSEIRYFLRKKNNTNRKIRNYQLVVLDYLLSVSILNTTLKYNKIILKTFIYLVVFSSAAWRTKKIIFYKKSNNYIINCSLTDSDSALKSSIKKCIFTTFIHLLSTYYYITKGKNSFQIHFHEFFALFSIFKNKIGASIG